MSYLRKREEIAAQLEMLRSGKMHTGSSHGRQMVDDTSETIAELEKADAEYVAALEILTRQPTIGSRAVHWYSLWRKVPDYSDPSIKNEWSVPTELSPDAALAYFEKHEKDFSGGLALCDEDDPSAAFVLEARVINRKQVRNSQVLSAGPVETQYHVKRLS